ncbi:3-oxoacyl-ACP reductase [Paenibacillus sp. J31TS4]|uniref:SDR family NAD(P)-dependent oxidoreductase n=1 Tax=Paenibacillus sp. J31TS4 TaxID=2807195 RepID=UPI001B1B1F54|nr:glucose 1-dehydrogenase [Paenibacillus sp. J31TS4]GIP37237.1 3-oxoacyl-ACP reductase [Paenibacillus sp. J31TS4]
MKIDLTGSLALVTGSSGGIGRGIALMLAESGARVAVNCLSSVEQGQEVVRSIREAGGEAELFQADVTDMEQIEAMLTAIRRRFGAPVDLLVNNAGHLIRRSPVAELSEDLYTRILDVNLKSAVFVSQAVIPGMREAGRGRIVNMTSVAAHNGGGPGAALYAASKAAVIGFTKGLAKELAADGVTVNAVSPGFIGQTAFHATFTTDEARQATVKGIPLGREGTPEDVAGAVLYLLSPQAGYLTGETIEVNGGMFMR